MVLLDTGTPGTSREIYSEDAEGEARTRNPWITKAIPLFKGGDDMKILFQHIGKVSDTDTYEEAVKKIIDGLSECTNKVAQIFL